MIGRALTRLAITALTTDQSDGSLWEVVSGHIYETARPQTAPLPCIEVVTTEADIDPNFDRMQGDMLRVSSSIEGEITVRIYAPLGDQETQGQSTATAMVGDIAERVRTLLNGTRLADPPVTITYIERSAELITFDDDAAVGQIRYAALGAVCVLETP